MAGKSGQEQQDDTSPANMRNAIGQLAQLGFSREDCARALKQCQGHLVRNLDSYFYVCKCNRTKL